MIDDQEYVMEEDHCWCYCHKPGHSLVEEMIHACCAKCRYCRHRIKMKAYSNHQEKCGKRAVRVVRLEGERFFKSDYSDVYFDSLSARHFSDGDKITIHRRGELLTEGWVSIEEKDSSIYFEGMSKSFFEDEERTSRLITRFLKEGDEIRMSPYAIGEISDYVHAYYRWYFISRSISAKVEKENPGKDELELANLSWEEFNKVKLNSWGPDSIPVTYPKIRIFRERAL